MVGPRPHRPHRWRVAIERPRERLHRSETLARPDGDPSRVRGEHPHPRRKHVEDGGGRCALSLRVQRSDLGARAEWPEELNLCAARAVSAKVNKRFASSIIACRLRAKRRGTHHVHTVARRHWREQRLVAARLLNPSHDPEFGDVLLLSASAEGGVPLVQAVQSVVWRVPQGHVLRLRTQPPAATRQHRCEFHRWGPPSGVRRTSSCLPSTASGRRPRRGPSCPWLRRPCS